MSEPTESDREMAEDAARDVAEWPDRTSPDDYPDCLLITPDEFVALVAPMLAAARAEERERVCAWTEDADDFGVGWETGCGQAFVLIDGTPTDNCIAFCCYCGGKVREIRPERTEDE